MKINPLASLTAGFFLLSSLGTWAQSSDWPEGPNPPADAYDDVHQFIFFAVLEGCYADGLTEEDLDLIIPEHENGMRQMIVNFVLMCPLCEPAFDAFNLYAGRPRMTQPAKLSNYTTFGPGLDRSVKGQLEKPGKPCRDAIQGLIEKWVEARIQKLRLNDEEEATLREHLAARRKKGEEFLKGFQEGQNGEKLEAAYADWKECPICSGSSPAMGG